MKKLDNRKYRLRRIFDYIGVIFLITLLLFIWQLYRGAIAVPFLKPYIIKALNHDDTEYQVTLDEVNLELVRSIKPLRIIATNVVYRKNNEELIINAPRTSVSFSIKALLNGVIAPSSIEIEKPRVYIFTSYGINKEKKENISQKKLEYYFDYMQDFLERFNSEDQSYPESYINDIEINNAEVEFHEVDLGKKWVFSDVNYHFDRGFTGMETDISALLKFNGVPSSVGLEAVYRSMSNKMALRFYFSDIIPANLMDLLTIEGKDELYKVDVPFNGTVEAMINLEEVLKNKNNLLEGIDEAVEKINFALEGGQGYVAFSDNKEQDYKISSLSFNGEISGGLDKLSINNAILNLDGQKAILGLEASGIKDYLVASSLDKLKFTLKAQVPYLKINDLYHYWPQYIATKAWNWCKASLFDGEITDAGFTFNFAYDKKGKKLAFTGLDGQAKVSGASLDYLTGMPKVTDIYGTVNFATDSLKIIFDKGVSDDVIVNQGYVYLYDLDKNDNFAKINLDAVGSIKDVLKLIDHKPLGYTSEMGINPDTIKGSAATNLDLEFELKENLTPEEVKVAVKSELVDVVIAKVVKDKSIEAKKLDLSVTNSGLLISGVTSFEGIPINLIWNENFDNKEYQSRYQLSFNFDSNLRQKLGIDFDVLEAPFVEGSIPAQAVITSYRGDKMQIDVNGNLQGADIDYGFLGFKKKSGIEGVASAHIDLEKGNIKSIPMISLSKPDFNLKGKILFNNKGKLQSIDIEDIKGEKTSAKAKIDFIKDKTEKLKITISGNSYNLSDFFNKDEEDIKEAKERRRLMKLEDRFKPEQEDDNQWENVNDMDINIAVNSLWTNKDIAINNFAGSAQIRNKKGIERMHLIGSFPSSRKNSKTVSRLKLDYVPRPNNEHLLTIESDDAGSTLKFLRLYDDMSGGTLSINAKRGADKNMIGHAKIRDFNIHNTPVFAKLLTVASLSGMVNLLTGDGMAFSHFDAPFEYQNNILKVNDAKAFGNVLGISGKGSYNMRYQEFDIKGLIAPAYRLNTFIGNIPIVGSLLSGKDGTVFAANYSITGDIDDPKIKINPLSALSPNSLKDALNSLFGSQE